MKPEHDLDLAEEHPLAWRLGRSLEPPAESADPPLADATLRAYRDGTLDVEQRRRVEAALAADPVAREQLASLAGRSATAPSVAVRDRVLEAFDRAFDRDQQAEVLVWRPRRQVLVGGLAAAAALILALAFWWSPAGQLEPLPADVAWSVAASGLAEVRGAPSAATPERVRLTPQTRLRIEATPDRAVADVAFTIYHRAPDGVVSEVDLAGAVVDTARGAAVVEIVAERVVGSTPGPSTVVLAVARSGAAPTAGEVAEALAEGRVEGFGWRLHPMDVELVPPP